MKNVFLAALLLSSAANFAQGPAGPNRYICNGGSAKIGGPDLGYCYVWEGLTGPSRSSLTVFPLKTTTYTLRYIIGNFESVRIDDVVVYVVDNPPLSPSNAVTLPTQSSNPGLTVRIELDISACSDGNSWHPIVQIVRGFYSEEYVRQNPDVPLDILDQALENLTSQIERRFEGMSIPYRDQLQAEAISEFKGTDEYKSALSDALILWNREFFTLSNP